MAFRGECDLVGLASELLFPKSMPRTKARERAGRLWLILQDHGHAIRLIAVAIIALSAVAMVRTLPVADWIDWLRTTTTSFGPWAPLGFVMLFVGLTLFCLPGVPLNVLSGVIFGPIVGGALTVLASNASAALAFLIGRLARRRLARIVRRYPRADAVYHTMGKQGSWKLVAGVRLSHALPFGMQNLLLGATPVSFRAYLTATVLVTLPGIFAIAYLAHVGAIAVAPTESNEPLSLWQWIGRSLGILVAAGALVYLATVIRQAIKKHLAKTTADEKRLARLGGQPGVWATIALVAAAAILMALAAWCWLAQL